MKKHYYLGLNARKRHGWRHLFTIARKSDSEALEAALESKYGGTAVLTKNGRTGLAMALKAYFEPGDKIIVNGFTCYAVIEAIKEAGCVPVYADIGLATLNYSARTLGRAVGMACPSDTLRAAQAKSSRSAEHVMPAALPAGIIIQNTLGIPVKIKEIEKFAGKYGLTVIEDLAHAVGIKYEDGREAGTIGAATVLSFGKDKAIDTISGGAVILRHPCKNRIKAPSEIPIKSDTWRERWYPLLAGAVRGLTRVHLGGVLMRMFLKLRWVERSADNRLDLKRRMPDFEAKLALKQLTTAQGVDREFYLVDDREKCLAELKQAGYHFAGFWYEKPVSPERYYERVHFPENDCQSAVFAAEHIINFPTYYTKEQLAPARKIVRRYLAKGGKNE